MDRIPKDEVTFVKITPEKLKEFLFSYRSGILKPAIFDVTSNSILTASVNQQIN